MKFTTLAKDLLSAAVNATHSIKPNTAPGSDCIKLIAAEGIVTLTATDLDLWQTWKCASAKVELDGITLLNADMFKGLLRSLPGDEVTIERKGQHVTIKALGRSAAKLATADLSGYPAHPPMGNRQHLVADLTPATRLLEAMAETDVRAHLHGLYIKDTGSQLIVSASNGYIACTVTIDREGKCAEPLFIPAPQAPAACRIGTVAISQEPSYIAFENNESVTRIKRSAMGSVDIPAQLEKFSFNASCVLMREELLAAISSAHCLRAPKDLFEIITVTQLDGSIRIEANNARGSFEDVITCRTEGDWKSWGAGRLNTQNLLWALRSGSDTVTLQFGDRSAFIRIDDGAVRSYIAPMRDK